MLMNLYKKKWSHSLRLEGGEINEEENLKSLKEISKLAKGFK